MANEAVLKYRDSDIQDFTCADGTGIEKGTVLKLTDPRTVIAVTSVTAGEVCAGIAAREKIANDGRTQISVYRKGDFDLKASGSITVGDWVISAGDNAVMTANTGLLTYSGSAVLGYALETASDAEVIQVRLEL